MSENQFTKKLLEQAEIKKLSLEDESDGGIAWHEYYFKYPHAENKMRSAIDMSITPVGINILSSDPDLKVKLKEEVDELDLDGLEDLMYIFRMKTIEEMERDVAPLKSRIPTDRQLEDEEIKEALDEMGEDDIVTDDEIADIMGTKPAETKGEASFDIGVSDEDIDGLM